MKTQRYLVVTLSAIAMLTAASGHARASLFLHESFDQYQPGLLGGQGGWSGNDSSAVMDFSGELSWSWQTMTVDGGIVSLRLTDHASYKDYSQYNSMPIVNNDSVYISFLVRGVGLNDYRDDTSLRVASNAGVGFSYNDGSPVIYAQRASGKYAWTPVKNDTTYLIVSKLWKSTGGVDQHYDRWTVFIDPTSPLEELNEVAFTLDGSIGRNYITTPRFWGDFYQDGAGKAVYYDEIKLGTSFSTVIPEVIPEPATMSLLGFGIWGLLLKRSGRRNKQ